MIVESYEDVIILSGALRSNFWETIHTAISLTLKRHPTGVIIDCSGITDATPAGAETFRDAMEFIQSHDARIIVAAVPDHVLDVLKTVPEVRSQLAVASSVEAARRSLDLLLEEKPKKKQASRENAIHVVVALFGDASDKAALLLGSQIADSVPAVIHLVYVVVVPRDLPLQAPMTKDEELAVTAIEHGKKFLSEKQLTFEPKLERGRDIASTLEDVLQEVHASRLIVPLYVDPIKAEENAKLVKGVLAKVGGQAIFVREGR